jgi:hypothetical protein
MLIKKIVSNLTGNKKLIKYLHNISLYFLCGYRCVLFCQLQYEFKFNYCVINLSLCVLASGRRSRKDLFAVDCFKHTYNAKGHQ